MKKLILVFIAVSICSISYGQKINYKYNVNTNQIFNVKTKISFKRSYLYNSDTRKKYNFVKLKTKIYIQIDEDGEGSFEVVQHKKKHKFMIDSCYKKTYNDSTNKYWVFNCTNKYGDDMSFYMHLENNKYQKVWFENSKDERVYYYN